MARLQTTLLGTSEPGCDGSREWRFIVNGPTRSYYTVRAVNRQAAEATLQSAIDGNGQQLGEEGSGVVTVGVLGLVGYGLYRLAKWWSAKKAPPVEGEQ